jgi:hypothetical protein
MIMCLLSRLAEGTPQKNRRWRSDLRRFVWFEILSQQAGAGPKVKVKRTFEGRLLFQRAAIPNHGATLPACFGPSRLAIFSGVTPKIVRDGFPPN